MSFIMCSLAFSYSYIKTLSRSLQVTKYTGASFPPWFHWLPSFHPKRSVLSNYLGLPARFPLAR